MVYCIELTVLLFVPVRGCVHSLSLAGAQVSRGAVISWHPCGVGHIKILAAHWTFILPEKGSARHHSVMEETTTSWKKTHRVIGGDECYPLRVNSTWATLLIAEMPARCWTEQHLIFWAWCCVSIQSALHHILKVKNAACRSTVRFKLQLFFLDPRHQDYMMISWLATCIVYLPNFYL